MICEKCPCENGTCIDGTDGTGFCSSCNPGYYGIFCNQTSYSLILPNLTIATQFQEGNILIIGTSLLQSSSLSLRFSNLTSLSNMTIFNSTIQMDIYSSLTVQGCLNISNSIISVNLNFTKSIKNLITIDSSCYELKNVSYKFLNGASPCLKYDVNTLSNANNVTSLSIIASQNNCANIPSSPSDYWIIVVIVASALVLIFIAIVLVIPSLRKKIFPFSKKRDERQNKNINL